MSNEDQGGEIQPPTGDYETFIEGETIDLVIPRDIAIHRDRWHAWFNDPDITRHSDHGLWPNTPERQLAFLESTSHGESDRLVLLIRPKSQKQVVGVISLSGINWQHRMAQVGMVIGERDRGPGAILQGLEAKALITRHAFDTMGLERVWGSQARPLAPWQRYQALFGFRVEGMLRNAFRRGQDVHDLIITSCILSDYQALVEKRGRYWPGREALFDMMRRMTKESPVDAVQDAINRANADYQVLLEDLE